MGIFTVYLKSVMEASCYISTVILVLYFIDLSCSLYFFDQLFFPTSTGFFVYEPRFFFVCCFAYVFLHKQKPTDQYSSVLLLKFPDELARALTLLFVCAAGSLYFDDTISLMASFVFVLLPYWGALIRSLLLRGLLHKIWPPQDPIIISQHSILPLALQRRIFSAPMPTGALNIRINASSKLSDDQINQINEKIAGRKKYPIFIVADLSTLSKSPNITDQLFSRGLPFSLILDIGHTFRTGRFHPPLNSQGLFRLITKTNPKRYLTRAIKRFLDVLISLLILLALTPFFFLIIALVAYETKSIFYTHERVGRNGRTFGCLKFQTMWADADQVLQTHLANNPIARAEWQTQQKLSKDPRVTKLGKYLRQYSLDELPQLINVLRGEMSLVGPRPVTQVELKKHYGENASTYESVRPGITGLWQVSGRNSLSYQTRIEMDLAYVNDLSIWLDMAIILQTVKVLYSRSDQGI